MKTHESVVETSLDMALISGNKIQNSSSPNVVVNKLSLDMTKPKGGGDWHQH